MKSLIITLVFILSSISLNNTVQTSDIQIGTLLKIGKPSAHLYQHLEIPKANIIIKRGGIADLKSIKGTMVIVTAIDSNTNGTTLIKFKRKDGGRFFGSHTQIEADLDKALQAEELKVNK